MWTNCLALIATLLISQPTCGGIAPAKEDIAILVENSAAMQKIDRNLVLPEVISAFVERIDREARIALILFDENAVLKAPFAPATGGASSRFIRGLKAIDYSDQHANSAAALERALHELKSVGRKGAGKSVILVSRGSISTGNEKLDANFSQWLSDVLAIDAAEARIRIFCIAVSADRETGLMKELAGNTGGSFYRVTSEAELQDAFGELTNAIFSRPDPDLSGD